MGKTRLKIERRHLKINSNRISSHRISSRRREMNSITRSRSLSFILFAFSLHFILGFSDDSPASKDSKKTGHHAARSTSTIILIVLIALVLFSLFSFALFKLWRKKKREEQYARLLKLFEEDDELELELGLRE